MCLNMPESTPKVDTRNNAVEIYRTDIVRIYGNVHAHLKDKLYSLSLFYNQI